MDGSPSLASARIAPALPLAPAPTSSLAQPAATSSDAPLRSLALMVLAAGSFVVMNALAARVARAGAYWQTAAFARASVGLVLAVAFARLKGASLRVANRRVMWTRSLAGCTGMLCTFYALAYLPLADATALLNTTPLWIALFAYVVLRESPGRVVLAALALAAAGIALVERPALAAGNTAGLVALSAGVGSALAMVSLRKLRGETPEAVVVHFSAVAAAIMGVLLAVAIAQKGAPRLSGGVLLELLGIGLTATVGQLAMTRAYALDRAARVGAAGWVQIVFAFAVDVLLVGHAPAGMAVAGIALMVAAGGLLTASAGADERAQKSASRLPHS